MTSQAERLQELIRDCTATTATLEALRASHPDLAHDIRHVWTEAMYRLIRFAYALRRERRRAGAARRAVARAAMATAA